MTWRSEANPRMGAYWLGPSLSAWAAAWQIAKGPSLSGKPWPRLTAPWASASADMWVKMVVGRPAKTGLREAIGQAPGARMHLTGLSRQAKPDHKSGVRFTCA